MRREPGDYNGNNRKVIENKREIGWKQADGLTTNCDDDIG
jgi:hypothetical protein